MTTTREHARYRRWYKALIGLYPKPYLETFGEGLEQTFSDLLRERSAAGRSLPGLAAWVFTETSVGILQEQKLPLLEFLKVFGGLLWSLAVATVTIIASLRGYENAWWFMLVVHAVVSAVFTLLYRFLQKKGHFP